jgi:hypothetical protein
MDSTLATGSRSHRLATPDRGGRARLWTESLQRPTLAPARQHKATLGTLGSSHDRHDAGQRRGPHRPGRGRRPGLAPGAPTPGAGPPWRASGPTRPAGTWPPGPPTWPGRSGPTCPPPTWTAGCCSPWPSPPPRQPARPGQPVRRLPVVHRPAAPRAHGLRRPAPRPRFEVPFFLFRARAMWSP